MVTNVHLFLRSAVAKGVVFSLRIGEFDVAAVGNWLANGISLLSAGVLLVNEGFLLGAHRGYGVVFF